MAASSIPGASISSSSSSPSSSSSSSVKLLCFFNSSACLKFHNSFSAPTLSLNFPLSPLPPISNKKLKLQLCSAVQELIVEETQHVNVDEDEKKKKLYVVNLPFTVSVPDIKNLFGECGTVKDVEIIKQKDGRNKGYAFVTMASGDESRAVIEKFDSYEMSGRVIRVEFAKKFKKPSPPPPEGISTTETRHKLYVSNLAWKARSTHVRELFSADFNPVSARVVFDSPSGRSAGYGFVSFATREEAEAALVAMDGKELMDRPIRLKFSEKSAESGKEQEKESESKDDSEAEKPVGESEHS